jgi:hypothetical protein
VLVVLESITMLDSYGATQDQTHLSQDQVLQLSHQQAVVAVVLGERTSLTTTDYQVAQVVVVLKIQEQVVLVLLIKALMVVKEIMALLLMAVVAVVVLVA